MSTKVESTENAAIIDGLQYVSGFIISSDVKNKCSKKVKLSKKLKNKFVKNPILIIK